MKNDKIINKLSNAFEKLIIDIDDGGNYFFEIKTEITNDISEAVVIMMNDRCFNEHEIWKTNIPHSIKSQDIRIDKTIYWLTGGDRAWINKNALYNIKWSDISIEYENILRQEIEHIFNSSKTFGDLRDNYKKSFPTIRILDIAAFLDIL